MQPEKKIINYFVFLKEKKMIGSSYIFIGNNFSILTRIIKLINCKESLIFCDQCWNCRKIDVWHHPDLLLVEPQGISIKIDSIRKGINFLSLKSYYSSKKSLIIKDAHKMADDSSNLFLKTLEEAPANSFIGLSVPNLEGLLPTIASRCRKIYLPYKKELEPDFSKIEMLKEKVPAFSFKARKDFALFLENLIVLLHGQLKNSLDGRKVKNLSDLFSNLSFNKLLGALESVFKIYRASNTVNINLALNLIKMRLE